MGLEKMTQIADTTGEMKSKNVREEIKYCELEAENNVIRPRIQFWIEWRYF